MEEKRMFFGLSVSSQWPDSFPNAKIIKANMRHITLAFLGSTDFEAIEKDLDSFPKAPFKVGPDGILDKLLLLPENDPNVVAYHAKFIDDRVESYRKDIVSWLEERSIYKEEKRAFLPHVTIGKKPKKLSQWKDEFSPMPFIVQDICLYESLGNSEFKILWQKPFALPVEEITHTADIAYIIRGQTNQEFFNNAQVALCYADEQMISFIEDKKVNTFDDVVIELNNLNEKTGEKQEALFKSISFHGSGTDENGFISWEMFVDV